MSENCPQQCHNVIFMSTINVDSRADLLYKAFTGSRIGAKIRVTDSDNGQSNHWLLEALCLKRIVFPTDISKRRGHC